MSRAPTLPIEPTQEQLGLAFRHLARPGWPTTLELALAHHVYGTCIRALARQLGRARSCNAAPAPARPLYGAAPAPSQGRPAGPALWDARRAAANDLDD